MGQEEAQTIRTQPGVGVSTVARDGAWGATQPGIQEGAGGWYAELPPFSAGHCSSPQSCFLWFSKRMFRVTSKLLRDQIRRCRNY